MSLFDDFPHKCTINLKTRTKGALGGSLDGRTEEQTDVVCWEQSASHNEILAWEKRGYTTDRKIYFLTDPGVTIQHEIVITERQGVAIASASQEILDVVSEALPDAAAGMGVVFKVMVNSLSGAFD